MKVQQNLWLSPSKFPLLNDNEVHIWRVCLNQNSLPYEELFKILSSDEQQRAGRYYFEKDRKHFTVSRASLREILGCYLRVSPSEIRFSYNQYGKPALDIGENANQLHFNLSHSRDIALLAVAREREVGIDVEFIKEEFDVLEVAEHFFSPDEISALNNLPLQLQNAAFFRFWTRREAHIKAVGKGLSHILPEQSAMSPVQEEVTPFLSTNEFQRTRRWSMLTLTPKPDYIAALAVEGSVPILHQWKWTRNLLNIEETYAK